MANQSTHGLEGLFYMGSPFFPAAVYVQERDPLPTDQNGIPLGTIWINNPVGAVFLLIKKLYNSGTKKIVGTWIPISGNFFDEVHTDSGTAVPLGGVLAIFGGTNMNTNAVANSVFINLNDTVSIGGTMSADDGFITLNGNINLPNTNDLGTEGVIQFDVNRFISNFGTVNTFVGENSGNTTLTPGPGGASGNTGIGSRSLSNVTTAQNCSFLGTISGEEITTGSDNCGFGNSALTLLTTGVANSAFGVSTLDSLLTGSHNIAIGSSAGSAYTSNESDNICIGNTGTILDGHKIRIGTDGSGASQQTDCYIAGTTHITRNLNLNTSDGSGAYGYIYTDDGGGATRFISNPGQENVFVGEASGSFFPILATPVGNTGVGANCFQSIHDASGCVAIGLAAGQAVNDAIDSTMVGHNSGNVLTDGGLNTLIGAYTGVRLTTGGGNTALGNNAIDHITTGGANLALGGGAGQSYTAADSSNIVLLNNGVAGQSNTIRIGTTGNGNGQQNKCWIAAVRGVTTDVHDAIPVLIDSTGQLGTVSSSERYKDNIEDMGPESDMILALRPVSFTYKSDTTATKQYGLIAEEVHDAFPSLVVYNKEGLPDTVKYHDLPVLLLNELQKYVVALEKLQERIDILEKGLHSKKTR